MTEALKLRITRRFQRDQAGQSIVLLAIAFIALIAFTGLVTDISVMFVRYSSLRRTIDASAIAAAQQIREGTDYGTVAFTAREFILLHGLEPDKVWVETCETDIANWRAGTGAWQGDPHPESNPAYTEPSTMGNTELCNWQSPRKLVRVTAQVKSPTFFLRILGIQDLTIEASSLSETAVVDVALVLDTSQSMASDTTREFHYATWAGLVYGDGSGSQSNYIRRECASDVNFRINTTTKQYRSGQCCNDPGNGSVVLDPNTGQWRIFTDVNGNGAQDPGEPNGVTNHTADGNKSDLICYPFKDVKDAARNFVRRLDYVRGDRVALVTFDSVSTPYGYPSGPNEPSGQFMMTSEERAMYVLNRYIGVNENLFGPTGTNGARISDPIEIYNTNGTLRETIYSGEGICYEQLLAFIDYYGLKDGMNPALPDSLDEGDGVNSAIYDNPAVNPTGDYSLNPNIGFHSYQSTAPCPDTNIGGGIRKGNDVLTNALTIRRDAVWVMILLTDGAANRTDPVPGVPQDSYGFYGFCPWNTFCSSDFSDTDKIATGWPFGQCTNPLGGNEPRPQYCNDDLPDTRHFCLQWSVDPLQNGIPSAQCLGQSETQTKYDADDYARDWADFAGLAQVIDGVPGNFIAIFTIGFGEDLLTSPAMITSAPLLRYIADAGDNGTIDNDAQQDLRDDGVFNNSVPAGELGDPDICEGVVNPGQWCGQYYYANNLGSLEAVFEAIASRLFTRLSR